MSPLSFIKDVLAERKFLLPKEDLIIMQGVERYSNLDINHIWKWGEENCDNFRYYLPDGFPIRRLSKVIV
jgi:hypothetical protein